jgi:hypothetical protein
VAQAPAAPVAPADRVIRAAPGDMNRVVATEATGRAAMTRVSPADLATLGGTIPAGPVVMTRVDLGDMTRERPGVQSRAGLRRAVQSRVDLAMPADTILVGRALMGRMPVQRDQRPVRRPLTAEPPLRTRGLLHPTPAEATPAGRRWDHQTQVAVATRREALTWAAARPADRTPRLKAIRPVGVTPRVK